MSVRYTNKSFSPILFSREKKELEREKKENERKGEKKREGERDKERIF